MRAREEIRVQPSTVADLFDNLWMWEQKLLLGNHYQNVTCLGASRVGWGQQGLSPM